MKILQGNFYEGERVTVEVNGKTVTRKVHYSKTAGDLFVWVDNNMFFYYEFVNAEAIGNE